MVRLEAHGWRAQLAPDHGASLTALEVRHPAGTGAWLPVLAPLADPGQGLRAGCFVMAPFANRIDGGRLAVDGRHWQIPLNRPEEGMAIHGFARDRTWRITGHGPDRVRAELLVEDPGLPWQFGLVQTVTLAPAGMRIGLELTNRGPRPMPFGLGLHPWFPKRPGTRLTFARPQMQRRDTRGLPLPGTDPQPGFAPGSAQPLEAMPWLDGSFTDWSPREAEILWPDAGLRLTLRAEGALRHLHVFVPDDRPLFCAEPVSHLPDAINRPALPGGMDRLAPGAVLAGAMALAAAAATDRSPSATETFP